MINKHWSRWVAASCRKHFNDNRQGVTLHVEGDERSTADLKEHAEFRIDGPDIKNPSRGYYILDVAINILVKANMNSGNVDNMVVISGIIQAAFTETISVFKFGNGVDDDQTLLGCLRLRSDDQGSILFNNFGQIDEDSRLTQATIEGRYRMELTV